MQTSTMKKILIGNTGLVGQTLKDKIKFDLEFNSSNISEFSTADIEGSDLYLSCLPATKWMVNKDVTGDMQNIMKIFDVIKGHTYRKVYLISTIDVYVDTPHLADESTEPTVKSLNYGTNRYIFELLVKQLKSEHIYIFRLPALFSKRIKKNILFDLLNDNNIDQININSAFQWYNLDRLVSDISQFELSGTYNLFSEPLSTRYIIKIFDKDPSQFQSSLKPVVYNYKTQYTPTGYLQDQQEVFYEIKKFVDEYRNNSISV